MPYHLHNVRVGKWLCLKKYQSDSKHEYWLCRCDCGRQKPVRADSLLNGQSSCCKSCAHKTHGQSKSGTGLGKASRTYESWAKMITRCTDPNYSESHLYLGRGIRVCDKWLKFQGFLEDMGERPSGMSLDRYPDMNGNYEKSNCRWATPKQQGRNTRSVKLNEEKVDEIKKLRPFTTLAVLAEKYGVTPTTIWSICNGKTWS